MRANLERESFSRRLVEALGRLGDDGSSPTRLAREFNRRYPGKPITLHAARKWLQGEAMPAQDKLRILAEWLGVAAEWLRYGECSDSVAYEVCEPTLPSIDFDLGRDIASLTPPHQAVVRALVQALGKSEKLSE